ncbi:hypothetical protein ACFSYH_00865 [Populibacterium corticicola]|uniref:DUF3302 domain-containing protein n=1 Tax=Populibacterium corticicola TaxID=1812826 RepID=A0ABW5XD55_9MICO
MTDLIFWVYRDNDLLIHLMVAVTVIFGVLVPVLFIVANNLDSRHLRRQALSLTDQSNHPNHAGTVRLFAKIASAAFLMALLFWPAYAVRDYRVATDIAEAYSEVTDFRVSARGIATAPDGKDWNCFMHDDSVEEGYLLCYRLDSIDNGINVMPHTELLTMYLQTGEVVYSED